MEKIAELKKQIENLEAMLKATREVRCNTEYLKKVEELEWQLREVIEDNDYYQSQLDEAKSIIRNLIDGTGVTPEQIKRANEFCKE